MKIPKSETGPPQETTVFPMNRDVYSCSQEFEIRDKMNLTRVLSIFINNIQSISTAYNVILVFLS